IKDCDTDKDNVYVFIAILFNKLYQQLEQKYSKKYIEDSNAKIENTLTYQSSEIIQQTGDYNCQYIKSIINLFYTMINLSDKFLERRILDSKFIEIILHFKTDNKILNLIIEKFRLRYSNFKIILEYTEDTILLKKLYNNNKYYFLFIGKYEEITTKNKRKIINFIKKYYM
ncbi:hypothetical protein SLOPH_830, partial [Spraguea lophii 42_110]